MIEIKIELGIKTVRNLKFIFINSQMKEPAPFKVRPKEIISSNNPNLKEEKQKSQAVLESSNLTSDKIKLSKEQNLNSQQSQQLIDETKLLYQKGQSGQDIYYLPSYLRVQVNDVISYDPTFLQAVTNLTLFFSIFYGDIDQAIVKQLQTKVKLEFRLDQPTIQLNEREEQNQDRFQDKKNNLMHWRIQNNSTKFMLRPDIAYFPFQWLNLRQYITIPPAELQMGKRRIVIVFNLLQSSEKFKQIIEIGSIDVGNYVLNQANPEYVSLKCQKSDQQMSKIKSKLQKGKQKDKITTGNTLSRIGKSQQKLQSFNEDQKDQIQFLLPPSWTTQIRKLSGMFSEATLRLQLVKQSYQAIFWSSASYFAFMTVLGFLTLAVFFQENNVGQMVASVATIAVAIGALIISIRQSYTFKDKLTLIEQLLFFQLFICTVPTVYSIENRERLDYEFNWRTNLYFITVLLIEILVISYMWVFICWLALQTFRRSQIQSLINYDEAVYLFINFNPKSWKNQKAKDLLQIISSKQAQIRIYSKENQPTQKLHRQIEK